MQGCDLYLYYTAILGLGLVTGAVASLTGGAGLICIPGLILLGFPAQSAIATIKFGALGANTSGALRYHKGESIDYGVTIPTTLIAMLGAYFGAETLLIIPAQLLEKIVAACLLLFLIFIIISKDAGIQKSNSIAAWRRWLRWPTFFLIGFWGSFFGGGFALFAVYAYILLYRQTFLQSSGAKMVLGIGIAVIATIVYGFGGAIRWYEGTVLMAGMIVGAYFGAGLALQKGSKFLRVLFIIMVSASCVKLLM